MKRIPSLDGLRAISVLAVILGHLVRSHVVPEFFHAYSHLGVRIFFVISGYLITTILLKEHDQTSTINLREFYIRRAYRILPAAGVYMLFALVGYWHELRWYDIWAMLLYLVDFDGPAPWIIGHLWSLSVEEQFYFLWPSVLKKYYRHSVAILIAVVIITPIYCAVCFFLKVPGGGFPTFPAVADNLAVGCLLAVFAAKVPKISPWMAVLMLLAVILIPFYPGNTPVKTLFELFILFPISTFSIAGLLLHVVRRPYRFLNVAPVVWLGRISYSLYLWQQPFFFTATRQPVYKLLLGVGLACLSYYLVEQPVLALREKRKAVSSELPGVVAAV
jgi:peptidoglycan/LPS O-acetylase OafA/YrhL